jgi:hypothetical protein
LAIGLLRSAGYLFAVDVIVNIRVYLGPIPDASADVRRAALNEGMRLTGWDKRTKFENAFNFNNGFLVEQVRAHLAQKGISHDPLNLNTSFKVQSLCNGVLVQGSTWWLMPD